jgi:uncharacterized membrane protein YqgA involved in biofilm formation
MALSRVGGHILQMRRGGAGMTGTIINVVMVLIGGGAGLLFGARLPSRIRESSIWAIALFVIALGVKMTLQSQNALILYWQRAAGRPVGRMVAH